LSGRRKLASYNSQNEAIKQVKSLCQRSDELP